MWLAGQFHAPAALSPGKSAVPILQEAGWTPGPVSPYRDLISGLLKFSIQNEGHYNYNV